MKKYAVTTTRFEGTVIYGFDDNNQLTYMELDGIHEQQVREQIWKGGRPLTLDALMRWRTTSPHLIISEIIEDISFDAFWIKYNYKQGKMEAELAWKKLSDSDKTKAITRINAYDKFIADKGIAKAYPQKYLNKKRFNDEYK